MANVFTAIQPVLFSAAKKVAQEPVGMLDAITTDFDEKGVAYGDTLKVPVVPAVSASDFTPGNVASSGSDLTAEQIPVTITKNRQTTFHLTGEQSRSLENGTIRSDWIEQATMQMMRTLRNELEADAWAAAYKGASRAATLDIATNKLDDIANLRKILRDNGAAMADASLVLGTTESTEMMQLDVYQNANQSGERDLARAGGLPKKFGFQILESSAVDTHTKGTGTSYQTNEDPTAVGSTTINADTGSGTLLAGDRITFAADSANIYIANTALSGGSFTIGRPGTQVSIADDNAITIGASYRPNIALERSAVVGVVRPPEGPWQSGTTATLVSDQYGLTYLLLDIPQDGQRTWRLHLAWGFKAVNSEFIAVGIN